MWLDAIFLLASGAILVIVTPHLPKPRTGGIIGGVIGQLGLLAAVAGCDTVIDLLTHHLHGGGGGGELVN